MGGGGGGGKGQTLVHDENIMFKLKLHRINKGKVAKIEVTALTSSTPKKLLNFLAREICLKQKIADAAVLAQDVFLLTECKQTQC
jgi:hypothetical protein